MIISLDKIIRDYNLNIKGVIHIGAHYGQEYKFYVKQGIKNMMFFEPVTSNYLELIKTLPVHEDIIVFNLALGNETGMKEMFVETINKGQSCSLLEPGTHLRLYPHIRFDDRERVQVEKLDNIYFIRELYNMINIDVQGYELEVFKGATETLKHIDIIYTEVNTEKVYKDCVLLEELDEYLKEFNFKRVLVDFSQSYAWGDALYLKKEENGTIV